MAEQKVLVPYNFSANDEKALDFLVSRFSGKGNASVTLFHVHAPVPEIDVRNNPVMEKMNFNISYLRQKVHEEEENVKQAVEKLKAKGFSDDRVHYMFKARKKDVAKDIVDFIESEGFDAVVLNRSPASITRFFTKSISDKVMEGLRKNVGVFIVS